MLKIMELKRKFKSWMTEEQIQWLERPADFNGMSYIYERAMAGKTTFCAIEGLLSALGNGKDQVFIANNKRSANYFIHIMNQFAECNFPKKSVIELDSGAKLYFIYPNIVFNFSALSGNVYIDNAEFVDNLKQIVSFSGGITITKGFTLTLIDRNKEIEQVGFL